MHNNSLVRAFVGILEAYYGPYKSQNVRNDVTNWIYEKCEADSMDNVGAAVKEHCPVRFGPPDVADVAEAVHKYEKSAKVRIRRQYQEYDEYKHDFHQSPSETAHDKAIIAEVMAKDGYDIDKPYALTAYIMARVIADYNEKHEKGAFAKDKIDSHRSQWEREHYVDFQPKKEKQNGR